MLSEIIASPAEFPSRTQPENIVPIASKKLRDKISPAQNYIRGKYLNQTEPILPNNYLHGDVN